MIKKILNILIEELAMIIEIRRNRKLNAMRKIIFENRPYMNLPPINLWNYYTLFHQQEFED